MVVSPEVVVPSPLLLHHRLVPSLSILEVLITIFLLRACTGEVSATATAATVLEEVLLHRRLV